MTGFLVRYRFLWYSSFSLKSEPRLYPPPPPPTDVDMTDSDVNSRPPIYLLTPENLMETSLVGDGLSSVLSLLLKRQFLIEI